jgi:hypothetical protein
MRRLVEAYVEEVGRAAIDLYGGRLRVARASSEEADAPESIAAMTRTPITVLVAGGTDEARVVTAALLRMVEQDEARAMLASLDRKEPSASTWDLVGIEVRVSEADVAAGKHIHHLVDEVVGADIVVWALPDGIVTEQQRAALAAVAEHFKMTPSLLAPAVLPVELKAVTIRGSGALPAAFSQEGLIVMPPVVVDPKSANPEADGARLTDALRRSYDHARRVKAVRWLGRMKAQRNYVGAGRQAASAIGSAVRSIFSRRSS